VVPENTLPEVETRKVIDQKLIAADWVIQDKNRLNLHEVFSVFFHTWESVFLKVASSSSLELIITVKMKHNRI
jgi:hypothetical protein